MNDDHDPQIQRVGRSEKTLGGLLGAVMALVAAWCLIAIMVAATWWLVVWIWP